MGIVFPSSLIKLNLPLWPWPLALSPLSARTGSFKSPKNDFTCCDGINLLNGHESQKILCQENGHRVMSLYISLVEGFKEG